MKLNIKDQKENPVLRRKEIESELVFTGPTPSKETVKNEIASQLKTSADVIEVKEITTEYGHQLGKAVAYVYDDVESKEEMVELNKKQVEKMKKAEEDKSKPKEEAKPAEAPKAEEKKEEAHPEEKPAEEGK